ncbi:unnamed protein product [Symbiodinium sp. CCMP2592]|nr:unnamed protein product [Symbiodinium sp. CCMP2592]
MNDSPGGLLQLIAFNNLSDEGRAIFLPATGRNFSDVERFAVLQTRTSLHSSLLLPSVHSTEGPWANPEPETLLLFWRLPAGHCDELVPPSEATGEVAERSATLRLSRLAILMVFKPCFPTPIRTEKREKRGEGFGNVRLDRLELAGSENFLSFNKIIGSLAAWGKSNPGHAFDPEAICSSATWFAQWTIGKEGYRDLEEDLKARTFTGLVAMVDGLYRAHRLHKVSAQYISKVTDIEARNRECLQRMPADEFENLLHPVFQEDEWILILLGGILGAIVGIMQVYCLSG